MNIKHYMRYFLFLLFTAMIIASCKVSKDYQRTDLSLPQQYRGVSYGDTSTIADIEWKTFFAEPELQALIQKGIEHNSDLLVATENIKIANQQLMQAKVSWTPQVNAQVSGQYNNFSKNTFYGNALSGQNHLEDYVAGMNITWEAGIWGKISRQREAALDTYLRTYEAKKAIQTTVVTSIAKGFYNLLMLDKQLMITKSNLLLSDSTVKLTRLLKEAGSATQLSVDQTLAQRETVAALIPQLEQSIQLQENALQLLTGQYPGEIARKAQLTDIVIPASLPVGLPASVVSIRPDVRAAELSVMTANAQAGVAAANMYPKLTITASGGVESLTASSWFNIPSSLFGIITGAVVQPVFNQRQLKTQYETAKLRRDQAVVQFRQSVLNAVSEVSNALVQINKLKEQEKITTEQSNALHAAIKHANLLYKSDAANYLDVIIAQSNALQADLNLASIRSNTLMTIAELYRSTGGGWK